MLRFRAAPKRRVSTLGLALALVLASLAGCGGEDPAACVDGDFDGFGENCEPGPDCDDANAGRIANCDVVPPPDCDARPTDTGCRCLVNAVADCYPGAPETLGVGMCRGGRTRCIGGVYDLCEGSIPPTPERCNEIDDDCDGRVDEGVRSPCGGCNPECTGGVWGESDAPFDASDTLEVLTRGEVTLVRSRQALPGSLWVPIGGASNVVRIDTEEAAIVARYPSGGDEPSRVAVDALGDAFVTNRAEGATSSIVKIASALSRCVDRDEDGLETSRSESELLEEDECVVLDVEVGDEGDQARTVAIAPSAVPELGGDVWVGLHERREVVLLNGESGEPLTRIDVSPVQPFASTVDGFGALWVVSRDGRLAEIAPAGDLYTVRTFELPLSCFLTYSLVAVDDGRLVITGFSCDQVVLFDPAAVQATTVDVLESPRGIARGADGELFVSHMDGRLSRLALGDRLSVESTIDLSSDEARPLESVAVAVDSRGRPWVVSGSGASGGRGVATRVGDTFEADAQIALGPDPFAGGDLTGESAAVTFATEGTDRIVMEGCGDLGDTEWKRVHVEAQPGYGTIRVAFRHGMDRDALGDADFRELGVLPDDEAPFELVEVPAGGVIELEITLALARRSGAPRVRRVGVEWICPGPE